MGERGEITVTFRGGAAHARGWMECCGGRMAVAESRVRCGKEGEGTNNHVEFAKSKFPGTGNFRSVPSR